MAIDSIGILANKLPTTLILYTGAYALDGGTTILYARDEAGKEHSVRLVQHAFPHPDAPLDRIPGRLYFNNELIAVRSGLEARLLEVLFNAAARVQDNPESATGDRISPNTLILGDDIKRVVQGSPEQNLRAMLQSVIDYVASEAYVTFAAEAAKTHLRVTWKQMELAPAGLGALRRIDSELRDKGIAEVAAMLKGKGRWELGPFPTEAQADAVAEQLRAAGLTVETKRE